MRASRKGHTDVVKLLLEHGADVNIVSTDEDAATALHFASEEGKINVVKLLLQSCADTTIKNVCCT
jgi:ankyrin repeat protein